MRRTASIGTWLCLSLLSAVSSASAEGLVRLECWGSCSATDPRQVCLANPVADKPIAISCDQISQLTYGAQYEAPCGPGRCTIPAGIVGNGFDLFCEDGGDNDAVVSCR